MKFIKNLKKFNNEILGYISYNWKLSKPLNKPMVLTIETTNICNLDCIICPRKEMKRKLGTISIENFTMIIDRISEYNSSVMLHFCGEPLLDKQIFEKIKYCQNKNIKSCISTNTTLLNNENASRLLESGLYKLYICMDGFNKETYEKIRKGANFETTQNNIINFMKLRDKTNKIPIVILQMIRTIDTEDEIKDFNQFWKPFNFSEISIKDFCTWGDQIEGIKDLSRQEQRFLKTNEKRPPCYYPWHSVVILWDGTVIPCCRDFDGKYVLGNIFNNDLDDIWYGEKLVKLREKHTHLEFNNSLCDRCFDMPNMTQSWYLINLKNIKQIFKHFFKKSST